MERSEAKIKKLNTYFTGRPCRNGHLAYRYTASGSCSKCINGDRESPDSAAKRARREAKSQLVLARVRIYDEDRESVAAAAWALAAARFPQLHAGDIDPRLLPTDKAAGTALYALYCHADDVGQLRDIANATMVRHKTDVAERRAQLLGQALQMADTDNNEPSMHFK